MTSGQNQSLREQFTLLLLRVDNGQYPAPLGCTLVFSYRDLGLQAYKVRDAKFRRISFEVSVDNRGRNMLVCLDAECFRVHGEVRVLVCAEQIIALKPRVQAVVRPCPSK